MCPWDICLPCQQSLWTGCVVLPWAVGICALGPGTRQQMFDSCLGQLSCCGVPWGDTGELCPVRTSPCTLKNKVWDLGDKNVIFSLPLFLYCWSWGSLLLSGEESRQGAGSCPAASPFCPSLPPVQGCERPRCEGKHSHGDSASPAVSWPWEHTGSACPAGHTGWQGSAGPWTRGKAHSKASARHSRPGEKPAAPWGQPRAVCWATGLLWLFPVD